MSVPEGQQDRIPERCVGLRKTSDPVKFIEAYLKSEFYREDLELWRKRQSVNVRDEAFLSSDRAGVSLSDYNADGMRLCYNPSEYDEETNGAIKEYVDSLADRRKMAHVERGAGGELCSGELVFLDSSQRKAHNKAASALIGCLSEKGVKIPHRFARHIVRVLAGKC